MSLIKPLPVSVCLVPKQEDKKYLLKIIKSLNQKYNTVAFIPHITIYGGIETELTNIKQAAEKSIKDIQPFTVYVEKIDYSEEWSKTLFIQIKPSVMLNKIHFLLRKKLKQYNDYVFNPHISLIYKKDMTKKEKLNETKNLKFKKSFVIDRIVLITPLNIKEKWLDVAKWQTPFIKQFKDLNQPAGLKRKFA